MCPWNMPADMQCLPSASLSVRSLAHSRPSPLAHPALPCLYGSPLRVRPPSAWSRSPVSPHSPSARSLALLPLGWAGLRPPQSGAGSPRPAPPSARPRPARSSDGPPLDAAPLVCRLPIPLPRASPPPEPLVCRSAAYPPLVRRPLVRRPLVRRSGLSPRSSSARPPLAPLAPLVRG